MTTEHKVLIGIGASTVLVIVGGIFLLSKQDERLNIPLMGQEVNDKSRNHVPEGTKIVSDSIPPAAGEHYAKTAPAGIYDEAPEDGYLIHSLEHGAVVLWYRQNLPKKDIKELKIFFNELSAKSIMAPRKDLDVPVAVSSWGRTLKLKTIDKKQIKAFFETNYNRAPENAPI